MPEKLRYVMGSSLQMTIKRKNQVSGIVRARQKAQRQQAEKNLSLRSQRFLHYKLVKVRYFSKVFVGHWAAAHLVVALPLCELSGDK